MRCSASVDKAGLVDDSRIFVSKTPISPAGPTASDLRMSKSLEETLQSFNMFETDEGMQARLLSQILSCFISLGRDPLASQLTYLTLSSNHITFD